MRYFTTEEDEKMRKLLVMKACVFEQPVATVPCALLVTKLHELETFAHKMCELPRQLREAMKVHK